MKALSVRQPWASLIATGEKTLELRSWRTHYRGPLVICASARAERIAPAADDPWAQEALTFLRSAPCPLGVAVAVVSVVDCRPFDPADADAACCRWEPGYFAWVLRDVRAILRTPVKGRLGFFDVEIPLTALGMSDT